MAAQLGYCGLDRQRRPLQGDEIRPCWEAADATVASPTPLPGVGAAWPLESDDDGTDVRPLQFVEVQLNAPRAGRADRQGRPDRPVPAADAALVGNPETLFLTNASSGEARWSLWGEPEA